jgi:hypothetical protein
MLTVQRRQPREHAGAQLCRVAKQSPCTAPQTRRQLPAHARTCCGRAVWCRRLRRLDRLEAQRPAGQRKVAGRRLRCVRVEVRARSRVRVRVVVWVVAAVVHGCSPRCAGCRRLVLISRSRRGMRDPRTCSRAWNSRSLGKSTTAHASAWVGLWCTPTICNGPAAARAHGRGCVGGAQALDRAAVAAAHMHKCLPATTQAGPPARTHARTGTPRSARVISLACASGGRLHTYTLSGGWLGCGGGRAGMGGCMWLPYAC